jgi:ABC-2 type transport system ATP-binding protein
MMIETRGLRKSFGKHVVLDGIDLDVAAGTIYALLGSNGAGKTTIVRILTTLLKPDGGTASVNGFDVLSQPARVREAITLTGQFAAVDAILTGRENLILIAQLRRVKRAGQVADDLLARFGLADAAGRRVATYSGGMRRRLDIAMSLIGNSPILFLDEPTTGLDPEGRMAVWQVIQHLAASGTTVFLTTQSLDEAEKLADRIAILHQGTIIVSGTLEELRKLLPPATVEYVERQPTLEEIFLAIVASDTSEKSEKVGSEKSEKVGSDTVASDTVGSEKVASDTVGSDTVGSDTVASEKKEPR